MSSGQIKNSFSSVGDVDASSSPRFLTLKISVSVNSVRYFVISSTHNQVIFFGDYTLHHVTNEDELAQQIEKIAEKDEVLQLPFSEILIAFDSPYELAPAEFAPMVKIENRLSQECNSVEVIFEVTDELQNLLGKLFPGSELLHLNSVYLYLLPQMLNESVDKLFVGVGKEYLDIVKFNGNKELQLMNRYQYKAASDFIYFVLLCCEELKTDRERCELVLMGEIDTQSEVYAICSRYFRSISFIAPSSEIHFSKAFENYPKHLHFNLYNLSA